jgi:hypothetical protein
VPDTVRANLGVAFPAFQTPSGLLPQAVREHTSDYAETQGQAKELARRTSGVWTDLPYSPGRYLAASPAVWTVARKEIVAARYHVIGAELYFNLFLSGTVTVAPASVLRVVLPERFKSRQNTTTTFQGTFGGVNGLIYAQVSIGTRFLEFYRLDFAAWPIGPMRAFGQMVVEVEEF